MCLYYKYIQDNRSIEMLYLGDLSTTEQFVTKYLLTNSTDNRKLSQCQLCRHGQHQRLPSNCTVQGVSKRESMGPNMACCSQSESTDALCLVLQMTCCNRDALRFTALFVGCLAAGSAYTLDAFTVYSSDLKEMFEATQSQGRYILNVEELAPLLTSSGQYSTKWPPGDFNEILDK